MQMCGGSGDAAACGVSSSHGNGSLSSGGDDGMGDDGVGDGVGDSSSSASSPGISSSSMISAGGGAVLTWRLSQSCLALPHVGPYFTSTSMGTKSDIASQPSCATRAACSGVVTDNDKLSCICSNGTMPSRQQARIHSLV